MNPSFEQSFKKRLQNIAKERNLTPSEIWHNIIAERFLVRLCQSQYRDHFVLKGGTLLAKCLKLGRETQDIDFAIERLSNDLRIVQKVFDEIVQIKIEDGFVFSTPQVAPLDHFHMQYQGVKVLLEVHFGKAHFHLFIDLGFGDVVLAKECNIVLTANVKGPLFESSITLKCYPMEFVFAEKLETMVHRGANNSRMKDFHDLFMLVRTENALDSTTAKNAIHAVFSHRGTSLNLPIRFKSSELEQLQMYWERYQRTIVNLEQLPDQISQVVDVINGWICQKLI